MVRAAGAEVVSSGALVSRFYATWSGAQLASHRRAAEIVAATAYEAFRIAGARSLTKEPITELELQQWIADRFEASSLEFEHDPIVAASENAANPHYAPSAERPRAIRRGDTLLIDLWAREHDGIYADQTWMGSLGEPSKRALQVWTAVRDARDASIALLRARVPSGDPVTGAEVDDAAREVLTARGFGAQFTHRTGHSIDSRQLHGSGPHIDNFESREERDAHPRSRILDRARRLSHGRDRNAVRGERVHRGGGGGDHAEGISAGFDSGVSWEGGGGQAVSS